MLYQYIIVQLMVYCCWSSVYCRLGMDCNRGMDGRLFYGFSCYRIVLLCDVMSRLEMVLVVTQFRLYRGIVHLYWLLYCTVDGSNGYLRYVSGFIASGS